MYEPYAYTNRKENNGQFAYPGKIHGIYWDKNTLRAYLKAVVTFQKVHAIPSNRILVGEFGGHRMSQGLEHYFKDLMDIFKTNGWHFAFYAFREDVWDGMDYELGIEKLPWQYWQSVEKGETPNPNRQADCPAFTVLRGDTPP